MYQSIAGTAPSGPPAAAVSEAGVSLTAVSFSLSVTARSAAEGREELVDDRRHRRIDEEQEHPDENRVDEDDRRRADDLVLSGPGDLSRLLLHVRQELAEAGPFLAEVHVSSFLKRRPRSIWQGCGDSNPEPT